MTLVKVGWKISRVKLAACLGLRGLASHDDVDDDNAKDGEKRPD